MHNPCNPYPFSAPNPDTRPCGLCGAPGRGHRDAPASTDVHRPAWLCTHCFTQNFGWRLVCSCGRPAPANVRVPLEADYRARGILCDRAASATRPHDPDADATPDTIANPDEARREIRFVIGYYLATLAVLSCSWIVHRWMDITPTIYWSMLQMALLYSLITAVAIYDRRIILPMLRPPRGPFAVRAWLAGLLAPLITLGCVSVQQFVFSPFIRDAAEKTPNMWVKAGWGWGAVFVTTAIFPAVFEEIALRGSVLARLLRLTGVRAAIIASAVMFAMLHLNIIGTVFYLVPMALLAGWIRWRSGSLLPCILLHFLHNGAVVLVEYLNR